MQGCEDDEHCARREEPPLYNVYTTSLILDVHSSRYSEHIGETYDCGAWFNALDIPEIRFVGCGPLGELGECREFVGLAPLNLSGEDNLFVCATDPRAGELVIHFETNSEWVHPDIWPTLGAPGGFVGTLESADGSEVYSLILKEFDPTYDPCWIIHWGADDE